MLINAPIDALPSNELIRGNPEPNSTSNTISNRMEPAAQPVNMPVFMRSNCAFARFHSKSLARLFSSVYL